MATFQNTPKTARASNGKCAAAQLAQRHIAAPFAQSLPERMRAQAVRKGLRDGNLYRTADISADPKHAANVEIARDMVAELVQHLDANDVLALCEAMKAMAANPLDVAELASYFAGHQAKYYAASKGAA